jgi:hypothetical protein
LYTFQLAKQYDRITSSVCGDTPNQQVLSPSFASIIFDLCVWQPLHRETSGATPELGETLPCFQSSLPMIDLLGRNCNDLLIPYLPHGIYPYISFKKIQKHTHRMLMYLMIFDVSQAFSGFLGEYSERSPAIAILLGAPLEAQRHLTRHQLTCSARPREEFQLCQVPNLHDNLAI